jgi:hypothetical protein
MAHSIVWIFLMKRLIDENTKGRYTTSDTFGNAVYEGILRKSTHIKILKLLNILVQCLFNKARCIKKEVNYDKSC